MKDAEARKGPTSQTPLPELLTSNEVAEMFRVTTKTVRRWADTGTLSGIRTLGGHRRYYSREVEALLQDGRKERDNDA